jgi:multimeric flavodoxin WrbA
MKILAISGSPRKSGNTEQAMARALKKAADAGAQIEWVRVYDIDYKGCIACEKCKDSKDKYCVLNDGITPLYPKIHDADMIVMGSPIYFGRITSPLKCLIDRFYAFVLRDYSVKLPDNKKFVSITVSGGPGIDFCGETDYFRKWFGDFLKMDIIDTIHIGDLSEKNDFSKDSKALAQADDCAQKILSALN